MVLVSGSDLIFLIKSTFIYIAQIVSKKRHGNKQEE